MDDYRMVDAFDRIRAGMDGRPDVIRTRISTVRNVDALVGNVSTFLVESVREKDEGDTIFLEVAVLRRQAFHALSVTRSPRPF